MQKRDSNIDPNKFIKPKVKNPNLQRLIDKFDLEVVKVVNYNKK